MRPPHPNPLARREGLTGRVAPFVAVTLLAVFLAAMSSSQIDSPWALWAAGALTLVVVTSPWTVPWARLPPHAQAVPPITYFVVVALMREAEGGGDSVYNALVALPVLWLALHGTRGELMVAIAGSALVFVAPVAVASGDRCPTDEIVRG